jgi:hypothetical protein
MCQCTQLCFTLDALFQFANHGRNLRMTGTPLGFLLPPILIRRIEQ